MLSHPGKDLRTKEIKNIPLKGIVVNNNDPLKLQRVQIRIKELHRGIEDANLPWASPYSSVFQGNTSGVGVLFVPVVGSKLFIEFQDEDMNNPLYKAAVQDEDSKILELVNTNYPHVYGSIDRSGNLFVVDTQLNTVNLKHFSGTEIFVGSNGSVIITTASNMDFNITGNLSIKASGNLSISAANRLDLSGSEIHENTTGPLSPTAASVRTRPNETAPLGQTEL